MKTSSLLELALLSAKDYRSFLKEAFQILKIQNPKFSYASFARKAGLASKSFARDVSLGRRRLTLGSVASFSSALGLSVELKSVFELLVGLEEKDVRPIGWNDQQTRLRLEQLKDQIEKRRGKAQKVTSTAFREFKDWFEIYAALGTKEYGAIIEQIVSRTGLKKLTCETALKSMVNQGICNYDPKTGRYHPVSLNPVFSDLGESAIFRSWFLHYLERARMEASTKIASNDALFIGSAVSVQSHRLPEFKKKLQTLLSHFAEDIEQSEGDKIAHVVAAFF